MLGSSLMSSSTSWIYSCVYSTKQEGGIYRHYSSPRQKYKKGRHDPFGVTSATLNSFFLFKVDDRNSCVRGKLNSDSFPTYLSTLNYRRRAKIDNTASFRETKCRFGGLFNPSQLRSRTRENLRDLIPNLESQRSALTVHY